MAKPLTSEQLKFAQRKLTEHAKNGTVSKAAQQRQNEFNREQLAYDIDLPAFLLKNGYKLKRESKSKDHYQFDLPVLGSTSVDFVKDGRWLYACGSMYGNAVDLMMEINGCNKKSAIDMLVGTSALPLILTPAKINTKALKELKKEEVKLTVPVPSNITAGRAYLKTRGIDVATFEMLVKAGSAAYTDNGLMFVGRKPDGSPGCLETRHFPGEILRHQTAYGSDRRYVVIIAGSNDNVEIVEGNFDAMALFEIRERGGTFPTIIVSGGKDSAKMFLNERVVELIKAAKTIVCHGDNEKLDVNDFDDAALYAEALAVKQKVTDDAHMKRVETIKALNPEAFIAYRKPENGVGDLAELNQKFKAENGVKAKVRFNF